MKDLNISIKLLIMRFTIGISKDDSVYWGDSLTRVFGH